MYEERVSRACCGSRQSRSLLGRSAAFQKHKTGEASGLVSPSSCSFTTSCGERLRVGGRSVTRDKAVRFSSRSTPDRWLHSYRPILRAEEAGSSTARPATRGNKHPRLFGRFDLVVTSLRASLDQRPAPRTAERHQRKPRQQTEGLWGRRGDGLLHLCGYTLLYP